MKKTNNSQINFSKTAAFKITVLALLHLGIDFCGGLLIPLPDPTLIEFYGCNLATIMLVVSGSALFINFIQPIAGVALAKKQIPYLLVLCPILAAVTSLIGLSDNYWIFAGLLIISGTGIGLMHPEATMILHTLTDKRAGLATSIFMSAGFLGFSLGSLIGGWWAQNFELNYLWILFGIGIILAILVRIAGLHNIQHAHEAKSVIKKGNIPFPAVLITSMLIAINLVIIYRLLPIFYVRKFGNEFQFMAGSIPFYIGLAGAGGSFIWGYLSDYRGCGILLLPLYLLGMPFYYFMIHLSTVNHAILPAIFFGLTIGGSFPLTIILARKAKSFAMRLRMGLCIGGAWGIGELLVIAASEYIDTFPETAPTGVFNVLQLLWIPMGCIILISIYLILKERKTLE
jgi:MFS family permease